MSSTNFVSNNNRITPDRRQSKTLLTVDERGSKLARNSIFDCQMVIENFVCNDFGSTFVDGINVFQRRLYGVRI